MAARRSYSDEEKAEALAALAANQNDIELTASQLEIPPTTLRGWEVGRGVHPCVTQLRDVKKAGLAERLEDLAHKIIDALPGKLSAASMRDASVSLGIAIEKAQLLRGRPTEVQEQQQTLTDDERARRINEILDTAGGGEAAGLTSGTSAGGVGRTAPNAVTH